MDDMDIDIRTMSAVKPKPNQHFATGYFSTSIE